MKIQIHIEHKDHQPLDVVTLPVDLLYWERTTKSKMTDLYTVRRGEDGNEVEMNIGYEDIMSMAHSVFKRTGLTTESFNEWVKGINVIEFAGIEETNPTQAGPSGEASQDSQPTESSE